MEKNGKRHILLVDDENEVLSTVSFLLETEGFVVTTAENGKKALEVIERTEKKGQELVDLVISDLIMPEMDGLTLVESINNSKYPIPVLVITGHGEKETVIDLMRRGCGDYLDKPFQPKDLVGRVNDLFNKKLKRGKSSKVQKKKKKKPDAPDPLAIVENEGWQTITPSGDISGPLAEQLRLLLVGLLDKGNVQFRFDLKNVNEITLDTLVVLLCFTRVLREHYKSSKVEIIHANKYIEALLHSSEIAGVSTVN